MSLYMGPDMTPGQEFAVRYGSGRSPEERQVLVETRTLLAAGGADTGTPWLGTAVETPQIGRLTRVRDLLVAVPTGAAGPVVKVVREIHTDTNDYGASATAEGAAKAEVTLQFALEQETVKKVTAWVPVTAEIFDDAPALAAYVDGRLSQELGVVENTQLLNGDGTGENQLGFLHDSIQSTGSVNADPFASVAAAIALVEKRHVQVDGVIMNSDDYWTGIALRHSTLTDATGLVDQFGRVCFKPTLVCAEMPAGTALVGAFRVGAVLREHEPTTIRRSDSHSDYFVKNKVAVVAETRELLCITRPDWFCKASVDVTP